MGVFNWRIMEELEKRIKELESKEKALKVRTYWLTALIPLVSILASIGTTLLSVDSKYGLDELDFTQEQITAIIESEDIVETRKKLQFLIRTNLIGDQSKTREYLTALEENLVDQSTSLKLLLEGIYAFHEAYDMPVKSDSIQHYYIMAIEKLQKSIELNPNNADAFGHLAATYHNIGADLNLNFFFKKAIEQYDIAIRLDSSVAFFFAGRANTQALLRNKDKACRDARTALGLEYLDESRKALMQSISKDNCNQG